MPEPGTWPRFKMESRARLLARLVVQGKFHDASATLGHRCSHVTVDAKTLEDWLVEFDCILGRQLALVEKSFHEHLMMCAGSRVIPAIQETDR